ncbi:MAG TPA: DUF5715 family protein [Pyrinomonadaceae bacterium]|nr:DUF5715 family protein [Pyrinomonadaceae bacterium]
MRQILLLIIACSAMGLVVLAFVRYREIKLLAQSEYWASRANPQPTDAEMWARALAKVKEDRGATGAAAMEIPTQLRHYEDRHWFLATQVAEVEKFNLRSCQDFVDLAAMIEHGELVSLPAVTETYILFGVGARADDAAFTRYVDDQSIALYDETELRAAYTQLDSTRLTLQTEITRLQKSLATLKKSEHGKRSELQKELTSREQDLQANATQKTLLDRAYSQPASRQSLSQDYESLQTLARNFAGRSYNLDDSHDRYALKVSMLSSLRPQAVKILEEVAQAYHDKFARPLPVSSLVRPEQYQHALRKVNRNAVLIDTPPHSTGLAFDIDYRYMSNEEQNFVMAELARLKDEGRIEVIRERNANYHVFAFVDGKRPADELITASLEDAGAPPPEADATTKSTASTKATKLTKLTSKSRPVRKPKAYRTTKKRRGR